MPNKKFSYNKKEKLKSRKQLERIFTEGKSFTIFPVKVFFELNDAQDNVIKTGVGVSKKNFKKAVERNRIKRLLRESYRTEKTALLNHLAERKKKIALFFLYIDKAAPEYILLKQSVQAALKKLMNELAS